MTATTTAARMTAASIAADPASADSLLLLPSELTARQAARTALAGPVPVTYGALKARVDALASALVRLAPAVGARADETRERVAIWMDKGPRYAEAILAVLQAGCAYVPLDAGQPASRVAHILGDAEPLALLTDPRHLASLDRAALPASVRALVVDTTDVADLADATDSAGVAGAVALADAASPADAADPKRGPAGTPGGPAVLVWTDFASPAAPDAVRRHAPRPDDLAAILYTSGSTGVPKGVRITHRNLTAFIGWARAELDVGPDDVFANHASFNFDLSTFDLFTAVSAGAALWIVDDARTRDVSALAEGIRTYGVTVWYSVPSVLHLLTASGALGEETAAGLRYVLFAGEVYPIPQLRELAAVLPESAALYNLYGPTETNVCTYHRVRPEDTGRSTPVPIGIPLPGARARVLDADGRELTGPDAFGELVIEGDCVTPGYWGRSAESAAAGHPEGRHATGDLVSYENGSLVYRGRKDRMVKLHGYRVELGEVEAALLRHPAVATAGVVVSGEGAKARIVASYTLAAGATRPSLLELKRHCARHLPAYMVPRVVVRVDALPYSANGKIDYPRLAAAAADPAPAAPGRLA